MKIINTISKFIKSVFIAAILLVSLGACSSYHKAGTAYDAPRYSSQQGRVIEIQVISEQSRTTGGGALLGAVLGGVVGHQLGGGSGKNVATGVGVIGGALVGNEVESSKTADSEIYRVTVRLDNGRSQSFDYRHIDNLQVGDRVRIENQQIVRL